VKQWGSLVYIVKFHKQHVSVGLLKDKGVAALTYLLQESGRVREILKDILVVDSVVGVHRGVGKNVEEVQAFWRLQDSLYVLERKVDAVVEGAVPVNALSQVFDTVPLQEKVPVPFANFATSAQH
jgi:hypothetical protein